MHVHLIIGRYSDWLRAGRSRDRTPVEARFFAPFQTFPGATHLPILWVPDIPGG